MDLFNRKALAEKEQFLNAVIALLRQRERDIQGYARNLDWAQKHINDVQAELREIRAAKAKVPTIRSEPLYVGESEEDLRWQLDNRIIDAKEFEGLMKQLEFDNAEITLDYESVDRTNLSY